MKKSSVNCGISINLVGIEDDKIHCLKKDRVTIAARVDIERAAITLLAPQIIADGESDYDPFAELAGEDTNEDDDESTIMNLY